MTRILLLLLAALTWLRVSCGRHHSPQGSYVMDFIFCLSDGSHVTVDTVHPSLLRSSSLSSPRWYHISRVFLPTYSWSRLLTCPNHLNHAFLHLSAMFSTLSLSLMPTVLTWSLSVWPHAHPHIFISVTSSFFAWELVIGTVSI